MTIRGSYAALIMAVALASFASGGVAQTTCPTRADLVDGITLTRHDPFFSIVLTATAEGVSEARLMDFRGSPEEVSSLYSHPLAVVERQGSDGLLNIEFQYDTSEIDNLPDLGTWQSPITFLRNGVPTTTGTFTITYLGTQIVTIGSCAYSTWVVHVNMYLEAFGPLLSVRHYAPDLGVPVLNTTLTPDGGAVSNVVFDAISAD